MFSQVQGGTHAAGLMPGHLDEPYPWLFRYGDRGPIAQAYMAGAVLIPRQSYLAESRWAGVLQGRCLSFC